MLDHFPQLVYNLICDYLGSDNLRQLSKLYPQRTREYLLDSYDLLDLYFSYCELKKFKDQAEDTTALKYTLMEKLYGSNHYSRKTKKHNTTILPNYYCVCKSYQETCSGCQQLETVTTNNNQSKSDYKTKLNFRNLWRFR